MPEREQVVANVFAIDRRTIVARDAATGEPLREIVCASDEEVRHALQRARVAQRDWGARTVRERVRLLRPVLERIVARRDEIARLISLETGKPRIEALTGEVFATAESLDYYLRNAPRLLESEAIHHRLLRLARSTRHHEPWGAVAVISPWNYPFYLGASIGLSALVAGNSVVAKPSEHTPLVGLEIEMILRDSGLPPALYQCLPGHGDVGQRIIEAGPDKVSFTGSVATGRKVAAQTGERLIPCSLELGGKDAAIVLEDAPLDRCVRALAWGSFVNAGQVCASIERIFVQDRIAPVFTDRFVRHVLGLRQGRDACFDVEVGPLVNRAQWEVVNRHVEDARAKGAVVLVGGKGRPGTGDKGGWFYEPTVLANVPPDALVLREETFGPVVSIVPVSGEEEAVRRANETIYGLTASVWTTDERRADRIARKLAVGTVYVNDHILPSGAGESAWGGTKASGYGRTRGPEGLLEMTRSKHVAVDRFRFKDNPLWFPYGEEKYRSFSEVIPALLGMGSPLDRARSLVAALAAFGWRGRAASGEKRP
jgi:acyl-CoA reductase-like NAD-dependent aldehyde dehydrogenase